MRIILVGNQCATYQRAGLMDEGKSFFTRKKEDLYYTPVEGRVKVLIHDEEGKTTMDEMMLYREGDIVPQDMIPYPEYYDQDTILAHMQEHKILSPTGMIAADPTWQGIKEIGKWVWAYFPLLLAGGVLIYAFLG